MANMFGQRFDSAQLHGEKDKHVVNQLLILLFLVYVAKKVAIYDANSSDYDY